MLFFQDVVLQTFQMFVLKLVLMCFHFCFSLLLTHVSVCSVLHAV